MITEQKTFSRRHKKYLTKKEMILNSALRVIAKKGFTNTSIEEIADGADCGKGSIYHYFKSKEEILDDILSQHTGKILALIESVSNSSLAPLEKLERLISSLMKYHQDNPEYFIITIQHFVPFQNSPGSPIAAPQQRYQDFHEEQDIKIGKILKEAQHAGYILSTDIHEMTSIIVGMTSYSILYWLNNRPSKDFVEWMSLGVNQNTLNDFFQKRINLLTTVLLHGIKLSKSQ